MELDLYLQEIENLTKEEHELYNEVGLNIARNLQRKRRFNDTYRLHLSKLVLKLVYCHNHAKKNIERITKRRSVRRSLRTLTHYSH